MGVERSYAESAADCRPALLMRDDPGCSRGGVSSPVVVMRRGILPAESRREDRLVASTGPPSGAHVTYSRQYRRCTKPGCPSCGAGGAGHGPYWYAYWRDGGRRCSRYLGKQPPTGVTTSPTDGFGEAQSHGDDMAIRAGWGDAAAQAAKVQGAAGPGARPATAWEEPTPAEAHAAAMSGASMPPLATSVALRVRTLGGFALWYGEQPIPWERCGRGAPRLLQCLLSAPAYRMHREQLLEAFWPEAAPAAAAARLRRTLYTLRRLVDGPCDQASHLRWEGELLALVPLPGGDAPLEWLDAAAFPRGARQALAGEDPDACRAALARYGGTYLPEEPYAEWAAATREGLARRHLALLLHLAVLCRVRGAPAEAERCLREALAADPYREEAALALMELLAAAGCRGEALRVYQGVAVALDRELGLGPQAALEGLRARLLAEAAVPVAADYTPCLRLPGRPSNLPAPTSSFVGRTWDRGELRALLGNTRLLTLTGPGGCGKSRLALEVAGEPLDQYPDGVWQVELAALVDPALVPGAVAGVLGVAEQPDRPLLGTLVAFLAPRHLLLLLDNCEHLLAACADLAAALLGGCPHLRILATSRQGLGLEGELIWLVPALAYPSPETMPPPAQLAGYEAVQLFLARARTHRPAFALTNANAGAVAQVCARLDGIPLALELAAARLGALSVEEVAGRLGDRFALLTGGSRWARPRQQTLRATMDWSWELLSQPERVLLRRLAVFAGGWTLTAAEAVCGDEETAVLTPEAVLDLLAALVSKSLVHVSEREGQSRYSLLETVRQYGQERLAEAGEMIALRDRHLAWCMALAEEAAPRLSGPEQGSWLARLDTEHDSLRAALGWAGERGAGEERLRLTGALWRFWYMRGHLSEGRRWLAIALAGSEQGSPAVRAIALIGSGALALQQGDYAPARVLHEEALALRRTLGDTQGIAAALNSLGNVAYRQGDYARAAALYEESLALKRAVGDRGGIAVALDNLGNVAYRQCDYARAATLHEEALALRRTLGDNRGIAYSLDNQGLAAQAQGDHGWAAALHEEALALRRALEDTWGIAASLSNLGNVAHQQGDYARALALHEESLRLSRDIGTRDLVAAGLECLAWVAALQQRLRRAARLGGAAEGLRQALGVQLWPEERAGHERALQAMRVALGEEVFAAVWASGAALALEQAVAEALAVDPGR